MKNAIKWAGIISWFVGLIIVVLFSFSTYHGKVLQNASHQQLLIENAQRLGLQEIQLHDARQQRGMNVSPPPSAEEPEEK